MRTGLVNFDLLKDLGSPAQHRGALDSLVEGRTDPWCRLVILDLIDPIHDLHSLHRAPAGHEDASERCIRGADREGVIHYASCACAMRSLAEGEARWCRGPPIGTAIRVEACDDLIESTAETFRRNRDPHPDRKPALGIPSSLLCGSHEAVRR
jgi:hypothetical protein